MQYRPLGRTGWNVSTISFGAWAIGGAWGPVDEADAIDALHAALDLGINFFDTADVYGDGASERLLARLRRERTDAFHVATKAGRRLDPHTADGYTYANLARFVERSLVNLETDCLDLVQLHSPPWDVYYRPEVFGALDRLVEEGKIRYYGVSVEKVEEALKAIEFPGVQSVQIIFNLFRQRPADHFFAEAKRRQVGILARLPLSSGMLTGKLRKESSFATGRPSCLQPPRRALRSGRDVLWRGLRSQPGAGGRAASAGARRAVAAAVRAALGHDVRCGDVRHSRCQAPRPGRRECGCCRSAAAPAATLATLQALYDTRVRSLVHQYW